MVDRSISRRDFLKGAGAVSPGVATAFAGVRTATAAQTTPSRQSADVISHRADLVLKNGKVITVDKAFTITEAIAISGDRILSVGPNASMAANIARGTRVIDLKGKAVIPGLIDGHAHMDREGLKTIYPSLGRVRSIGDIQDR